MTPLLAFASMFWAAVISALVPAVNAEIVLLAASAASPPEYALPLILATTLGQMVGKVSMFYGGRGVKFFQRGRIGAKIDEVRQKLHGRPTYSRMFILTSATTGMPPFYIVSIASGLIGMRFIDFVVPGTFGRFLRFSLVVLFPQGIKVLLK